MSKPIPTLPTTVAPTVLYRTANVPECAAFCFLCAVATAKSNMQELVDALGDKHLLETIVSKLLNTCGSISVTDWRPFSLNFCSLGT